MGLATSLAEGLNIGWGVVAGEGASSIREKLIDWEFRREVIGRLAKSNTGVDASPARKIMASEGFVSWLNDGGEGSLENFLSGSEVEALGITDDTTSAQVGQAIGQALAAVSFDKADWVHKEILRSAKNIDETTLTLLKFLQDIWALLTSTTGVRSESHRPPWRL